MYNEQNKIFDKLIKGGCVKIGEPIYELANKQEHCTGENVNMKKLIKDMSEYFIDYDEYSEEFETLRNMQIKEYDITIDGRCDNIAGIEISGNYQNDKFLIKDVEYNDNRLITLEYADKIFSFSGNDDEVSDLNNKIDDEILIKLYSFLFSDDFIINLCIYLQEE